MEPERRKTILGWGTFLVALLAYVAPLGKNTLGIRTAQVVASVFGLYLILPPIASRVAGMLQLRGRLKRLHEKWPAFRARVTTFRELFTPANPAGLGGTIERTGRKPAEYNDTLKIETFVTLMDALSVNLAREALALPTLQSARRIARDFETLLPVVEGRGAKLLVRLTDAQLDEFFSAYATFRQSYREFAHEANVYIGDGIFDGH